MDILLTVIICLTQLVLGYMGVHVALRPPKAQHHKFWIAGFLLIGLAGIGATAWLSKRSGDDKVKSRFKICHAVNLHL